MQAWKSIPTGKLVGLSPVVLGFSASRTMRNQLLLLDSSSLWGFVVAESADLYAAFGNSCRICGFLVTNGHWQCLKRLFSFKIYCVHWKIIFTNHFLSQRELMVSLDFVNPSKASRSIEIKSYGILSHAKAMLLISFLRGKIWCLEVPSKSSSKE